MAYVNITTLPTAPSRARPSTFAAEGDAFLAALATFVTEVNTSGSYIDGVGTAADTDAATATTQAAAAATSATDASNSATASATSASNSSTSETNAAASAAAAAASLDSFDDRYLGAKSSDPTTDNDGDPLSGGMIYYNTGDGNLKLYNGSSWVVAVLDPSGAMLSANNLSDLASASTSITNLGITATAAELNFVDGVTSNIQTQINSFSTDPTLGTLTKSFLANESSTITLSSTVSPTAIVAVTKEVGQTGVSSKGAWDVASDAANYELYNQAPSTSLSLSSASADGTATLGTGSFASSDVGKRIFVDDGGEAVLTATDGSYSLSSAFGATTYTSGNWSLSGLDVDSTYGLTLNKFVENAFDLSTASYDSVSFSFASQETNGYGVFFKPDGTKMYVIGYGGDDINEYNLSTPWDITTATFGSITKSVATEDVNPYKVFFKPDGLKMYVLGATNTSVFEYALGTAWAVNSASYSQKSIDLSPYEQNPRGLFLRSDGLKMYFTGDSGNDVNEYDLGTAWDISSATYLRSSYVGTQEVNPRDLSFSPDGTKMFVLGRDGEVNEYALSTAWNISTKTFVQDFQITGAADNYPLGIFLKPDGSKMYILGDGNDSVFQFSLGTVHDVTAEYLPAITSTAGQIDSQYWTDINSMTADDESNGGNIYYAVSTDGRTTWSTAHSSKGVRSIARDNSGTWQYNSDAGTAFAIEDAAFLGSKDVSNQDTSPAGIFIKPDGSRMYITGNTNDKVYEYNLSVTGDVSSATIVRSFIVSSQDTEPYGIFFKPDGTKMFVAGSQGDTIEEYALSTAWNISTASSTTNTSVNAKSQNVAGLTFKPDGTRMYITDRGTQDAHEYALSTAWDVSSASFTRSLAVAATSIVGINFKPDGLKMYLTFSSAITTEYNLSTAWDISTATESGVTVNVNTDSGALFGAFISSDGLNLYTNSYSLDKVSQFSLQGFSTSETWVDGTTNDEFATIAQAMTVSSNRMAKAQVDAVTDGSHFTLGNTLDLAIIPYLASSGTPPTSDGISINYDAAALNKGAILGTDYDYDIPATNKVSITSKAAQNLKVRIA